MISIGHIYKTYSLDTVRISSVITINGLKKNLFFETSLKNEKFLCDERSDSFLIALLITAMTDGVDIKVEQPVSSRLLYGIKTILMPALIIMNSNLKAVNIDCVTTSEKCNIFPGVATGLSGGVDSFYSILKHLEDDIPSSERLTHLLSFNSGSFGYTYETSLPVYESHLRKIKKIGEQLGLEIVSVSSNIKEFMNLAFEQVSSFCHMATALSIQKLLKYYYYASGTAYSEFGLNYLDVSLYDLLNDRALSTESTEVITHGSLAKRIEKVEYISNYSIVQKNLNVCLEPIINPKNGQIINCSHCDKCIRTMTAIDIVSELDKFSDVFDVKLYNENIGNYWGRMIYKRLRMKDEFVIENMKYSKTVHYKIPYRSYLYMIATGVNYQIDKVTKNKSNAK